MVVWEPRECDRGKHPGGIEAGSPQGGLKLHQRSCEPGLILSGDVTTPLPDELNILNRYGIGQPYLRAAHKASIKTGVPALEILVQAGVISRETWLDAQHLLGNRQRTEINNPATRRHLLTQAIHNLRLQAPHYSAETTFSAVQLLAAVLLLSAVMFGAIIFPQFLVAAVFALLAAVYFSCILFRGALLFAYKEDSQPIFVPAKSTDHNLPVYSVLVALYRESDQVGELADCLQLLDWPQDRLDIKLICEEDDPETIFAIRQANLPFYFELIVVPPALPRTKPKALNYALPLCRGEYLVLYDAEDRPSPGQLREAYETFARSSPKLACLQAPLAHSQWQPNLALTNVCD